AAAARALDVLPGRMARERVARLIEGDVLRQLDRQRLLRHRHNAAGGAVDHRDRTAPIALARHAPVAQAIGDRALAVALLLKLLDGAALGARDVEPVEELGIVRLSVARERLV